MGLPGYLSILTVLVLAAVAVAVPTAPPTIPPPAPWFPNRHPETFQSGERATLYSSMLDRATFMTEDRTDFRFQVKACSDAVITFDGLDDGDVPDRVTLQMGSKGNTQTMIKHKDDTMATMPTPDLLHCHEFRSFWISWRTNLFQVGRGPVVGQNFLIGSPKVTSVRYTMSVTLNSGLRSNSVVWAVMENSADMLIVSATGEGGYNTMWKDVGNRNFITFSVMSCQDAKILLTSQYGGIQNKVYEIVFGAESNTKSLIRTQVGGGVVLNEKFGRVLDCQEVRDFWISWFNHGSSFGTVKVGQGTKYGINVILDVTDTEVPVDVRHLAVASDTTQQPVWNFEEDMEDVTMITTQNAAGDNSVDVRYRYVWLESLQSQYMTFFVSSCNQVSIHLSTTNQIDEEFGVELIIGANNNTKSILRPMVDPGNLDSADTPDILHCKHTRYFWMSWRNGYIRFGKGRVSETNLVLQAQGPANSYFGMSLSSRSEPALWAIKARYSENLNLVEPGTLSFPLDVWRTVRTKREFTFQVKACSDVIIKLSPFPGSDSTSFYYQITLNAAGSNLTVIDLVVGNGAPKQLVKREVPDLLSCDSFREFYVNWWAGRIKLGRGRSQGRLLSYVIEADHTSTAYHIQSVALTAEPHIDTEWSIRGDVGDVFTYHTKIKGDYQDWITLLPGTNMFTFDVAAGSDAHLMLLESLISPNDGEPMVEIVISGWDNTQSVIRNPITKEVYVNVTHPVGLLDDFNARTFWIKFDNVSGLIRVGGGNPLLENGEIMSWPNPKPFTIRAIGFKTGGDYDGRWYVRQHMGHMTLFPTHVAIVALNSEETWRDVEHVRSIFFRVEASSEVSLTLAQHSGIDKTDALTLVIGGANNTVSYIKTAEGGDIFLKANTSNILDPNGFNDFWVSWNEGEVAFGKGSIPGDASILNFQVIMQLNIRAIRFSTTYGSNGGQWQVQMWNNKDGPTNIPIAKV